MDYDLSEEQQTLKEVARKFLSKECPASYVRNMEQDERGYVTESWRKMVEMGWIGLLIPQQYGGAEMSFLDLTVLLYEMGYACLPGPFFPSSVVGVMILLKAGSDAQKETLLREVAAGDRILTLAWPEENGTYSAKGISTRAECINNHYVLSGTKLFVQDAHVADSIICAVRTEDQKEDEEQGISLFVVNKESPGLRFEALSTIGSDKQFEVIFDQVQVPRENLLGELNQGWPALRQILLKASVAKCAEMSGGAQKVLDLVVAYAKEREQFDRPIGSFQAVQHHCANILSHVETSRLMTYQAAWRITVGSSFEKEASMCKAWVNASYQQLLFVGHQVMGGTGYMEEHDLQLYFRRAKAAELAFGDGDFHREMVAQQMCL